MDEFSDYEKHFTVMNYQNPTQLKQIHYDDFIGLFEQQYPNHKWSDIQVVVCVCVCVCVRACERVYVCARLLMLKLVVFAMTSFRFYNLSLILFIILTLPDLTYPF